MQNKIMQETEKRKFKAIFYRKKVLGTLYDLHGRKFLKKCRALYEQIERMFYTTSRWILEHKGGQEDSVKLIYCKRLRD